MGPKEIEERLRKCVNAWETLAPAKSYSSMTLAQFKTAIAPSFDARVLLDQLDDQQAKAINDRDTADEVSLALVQRVINAVLADPDEGPDSSVLEAMGRVRQSERKSGLTRKGNKAPSTGGTPPPG